MMTVTSTQILFDAPEKLWKNLTNPTLTTTTTRLHYVTADLKSAGQWLWDYYRYINPKKNLPTPDIFCYVSASWHFSHWNFLTFFFGPCAWFKTIFVKIGPRVMTLRCVIAHWVNEKLDFPLKLHINRVFCALPLCFILFIWFICSKNVCKHSLTHIIAKKCNFCLKK